MITVRINGHDEGCMSQDPDGGPCTCSEATVLYAVTTIENRARGSAARRTPAVCMTLDRAKEIVEKNEGDIWECFYMYAVVETVIPDRLYSFSGERYWYEWNLDKGCYLSIECPEQYKDIVGFGIG